MQDRADSAALEGGAAVEIIGQGFSLNTLDWVNFGPARSVSSQQLQIIYISPTQIVLKVPPHRHLAGKSLPGWSERAKRCRTLERGTIPVHLIGRIERATFQPFRVPHRALQLFWTERQCSVPWSSAKSNFAVASHLSAVSPDSGTLQEGDRFNGLVIRERWGGFRDA